MNPGQTPAGEADQGYTPTGADYVSDRDFTDLPLSQEVLQGLADMGYVTATPVQATTIEPALAQRDMVVRAKTGTGKTAAFGVPMIELMDAEAGHAVGLVLAPTRELAQQIAEECGRIGKHKGVKTAVLVGGVAMGPQIDALEGGATFVVGTPGRILDLIRRGHLDLSQLLSVAIDEADEMVSMGFLEDVTSILDATPEGRQVLLFSATVSAQTQRIISRYLDDPEQVYLSTDTDQVENIDHVLYETKPGMHRMRALLYLLDLEAPDSAIVFCNRRDDASTLAAYLDRQGYDVQLLSGELSQDRRNRAMARVKRGDVSYLVATDVAARGIDISELSHVINYSLPDDPAIYLHRTGRTGRLGRKGRAISLVGGTDLNTRRALINEHGIDFLEKEFPDDEQIVHLRVDRQVQEISAAMGTLAFEAYLPTVRELRERDNGDVLLAAALRAFFQWNRTRRAAMAPPLPARSDEDRGGKKRKKRGSRDRDDRPSRRRRDSGGESLGDDLEALLVAESKPESEESKPKPKRKRKRRRRKKKPSQDEAPVVTETTDLEAEPVETEALLIEGEGEAAPEPKDSLADLDDLLVEDDEAEAPEPSLEEDDLDALLSLD